MPRGVATKGRQFAVPARTFARGGGIASSDEVVKRLRRHTTLPLSVPARLIVRRDLLNFGWRGETLLPMYQFAPVDMSLRPVVLEALIALRGALDDWALVR